MSEVDRQNSADSMLPDDGDPASARDLTGVTLGDFHVEKILGRGGMGEVYLATQLSLSRPVALKVLRSDFASNKTYLGRLRTEATAVAKLNHSNIVHVYTLGAVDGINFIAMEYVQGTNLKDYILKKGALELPLAFSIMRQAGQAIGAAGEIGLIHRDIKPENILMTKKGRVKVADFGLCRDQDSRSVHLTQTGVTMGTPLYMSPEQAQGHAIDHRSDLYSLGVTFYHMLAGVPPFHAETALALALKQVRENPRSILVHRPDLPVELDQLVLKLMAKAPEDRYQSAAEMLADLAKIRESLDIGATAVDAEAPSISGVRVEDSRLSTSVNGAAARSAASRGAASGLAGTFTGVSFPVRDVLARLNPGAIVALSAACLVCGAVAGWSARNPDVQAISAPSGPPVPGLWLEPRWATVLKQNSPEDQLRYAILQAPREEWVPAFMAVAGYFPHSHEPISKAYTQLARIWYRRCDLDALGALERELSQWKDAKQYDQELVHTIRVALKLRKGDFEGVVQGMKNVTEKDVPDMFDPALVEMNLEICVDAIAGANRASSEALREALQVFQAKLVARLYQIELPKGSRLRPRALEKKAQTGNRGEAKPSGPGPDPGSRGE
jgi:serine/threonine-protein kinase